MYILVKRKPKITLKTSKNKVRVSKLCQASASSSYIFSWMGRWGNVTMIFHLGLWVKLSICLCIGKVYHFINITNTRSLSNVGFIV